MTHRPSYCSGYSGSTTCYRTRHLRNVFDNGAAIDSEVYSSSPGLDTYPLHAVHWAFFELTRTPIIFSSSILAVYHQYLPQSSLHHPTAAAPLVYARARRRPRPHVLMHHITLHHDSITALAPIIVEAPVRVSPGYGAQPSCPRVFVRYLARVVVSMRGCSYCAPPHMIEATAHLHGWALHPASVPIL
ncbi:hypothetical protein BV25DRAFT_619960 [Artomyces pyxidatus]|uniref:Uncharacterized protein n=1 Tax=Artomyces pyxidatus TaxID=48021 RepID=A0ACB8T1W0_9AGAM|nr:hypothetical protein BV25DRAFT_619960 [Artomyces pyxidatus]